MANKGPIKVLLAEDDAQLARMYERAMRNRNYTVTRASDGTEAIKILDESAESWDVILLDILMPNADGIEVLRHIREKDYLADVPVFILSNSYPENDINKLVAGLKLTSYLVKSENTPEMIINKIEEALNK
jgi:two-component system, OmpR family, response regulator